MPSLINYRDLNISSDPEVAQVAEIHETAPGYWIPGYCPEPKQIGQRIEQLKKLDGCTDRFFQLAETSDGKIVGFHWLDLEETPDETFGHIKSLWVHDDYQHQGIAYELKRNGEIWAKNKGVTHIKTTVHANNAKMLKFNLRFGFKQGFIEMEKRLT